MVVAGTRTGEADKMQRSRAYTTCRVVNGRLPPGGIPESRPFPTRMDGIGKTGLSTDDPHLERSGWVGSKWKRINDVFWNGREARAGELSSTRGENQQVEGDRRQVESQRKAPIAQMLRDAG